MLSRSRWIPAILLSAGCVVNAVIAARRAGPIPLRAPLSTVASRLDGLTGTDDTVTTAERRVAGMTSYIVRDFGPAADPLFSVYVGYYDEQRQGKSIHSPKNCLPGDGWEPVEANSIAIATASGAVVVNRYRVAKHNYEALVYYWYQGRGRVAHDEFRVKLDLFRDAALHGRTEEALVRIVVPVHGNDVAAADRLAQTLVSPLVADMDRVLPQR
jgi:EpsI family protein